VLENIDALNCNYILANFIDALASFLHNGERELTFIRETCIVVNMLRTMLNARGYEKTSFESVRDLPEYCSDKHNKINIIVDLLDNFLTDLFPAYLSNLLE
jgi:hypothetical protein